VYWGDQGENQLVLERWDTISLPPGVMRGFTNAGTEDAYLLGITGGSDSGHVFWAPQVLEQAKASGLSLDERGNLITASRK
jgi:hypothetical protein